MSQAMAAPRTGFKFLMKVSHGPDQGATYQLLPPKVTIGRGADNNVVLKDPRVSRTAALIEFTMQSIMISDVSGRQNLFVNGEQVPVASIKDGDVIQLGETQFTFQVEAMVLAPPQALAQMAPGPAPILPFPGAPPPLGAPLGQAQRPVSPARARAVGPNRTPFVIIVLVVVAGALWLFMQPDGTGRKRDEPVLRTADVVEKDLRGTEERIEVLSKKRAFKSEEERTRFEEAQKHYLEGFRDYQKGQWLRAMRSFETARAIDPDHVLALRYHKLAEKQRDETVALLILEGRRYRDKNMYTRCSAAFEKVMGAIPNRDDAKYKEAQAFKKECDFLEDERFQ